MTMPLELQWCINETLEAMRSHPQHHLMPSYRQAIYVAMGEKDDPFVIRARGWLAIIAAKKVLPIFQQVLPEEKLPQQLLDAAFNMLDGTADAQAVHALSDEAYIRFGAWLEYSQDILGYDGEIAAFAAYKALVEIHTIIEGRPYTLLEGLHEYGKFADEYEWQDGREVMKWVTGDQWTDEDWSQTAAKGDTVSVAAVAFACGFEDKICNPQKLQTFWEWWLNEAIPAAWEKASVER